MKIKSARFKILATVLSVLSLWAGVSWTTPDECLRPQPTHERPDADLLAANVRASIETLKEITIECSKQLLALKAELNKKKTRGKIALFGLWAERRMLILQDMSRLKRWLVANNPELPVPEVNLETYQEKIPEPSGPAADEEVSYAFFPNEKIIRGGKNQAVAQAGKAHMTKTLCVYMAGGRGTRLRELYTMSDEQRQALGVDDVPREEFEDASKPTVPLTKVTRKSPFVYDIEAHRRIAQDLGESFPPVIIDGEDTRP